MEEIEKVKQELQQQFALQLDELKKLYEQERKQREQLEFQLAFTRAAQRVDEHIQAGRMPPIFREIVIAALLGQNTVTFARDGKQEEMALGEALLSAFATLPPLTGSLPKSNGDGDLVAALKEIGFDEATAKFAAELKQKEQKEGVKWPH